MQSRSGWATVPTPPWCRVLLPEASGEVRDPPDAPGQTLVTQPGPVMASLLLQPSQTPLAAPDAETLLPPQRGRKGKPSGWVFLLSHLRG